VGLDVGIAVSGSVFIRPLAVADVMPLCLNCQLQGLTPVAACQLKGLTRMG
jgi:hypothetical protein